MADAATKRLYLDPEIHAFSATVIGHGSVGGSASVVLDASAFYPESGGQRPDRGVLAGSAVLDVQLDAAGRIHHVLDGALPTVGAEVEASIDVPRRRLHMAQHTGQHMLSRALLEVAGAHTVSSRLGESLCTVDVDVEPLSAEQLQLAEGRVNDFVDQDVPVRAFFPASDELAELPLRKPPRVDGAVRVVAVGDFDMVPCGGTHCSRSSQVGLLAVLGRERYKGLSRVSFAAGSAARAIAGEQGRALRQLARELGCRPLEASQALGRLRRELEATAEALELVRERLAEHWAERLGSEASGPKVVGLLVQADIGLLRAVGRRLVAGGERVALLAATGSAGLEVFVSRGPRSDFDCGAFVRAVAQAAGGKGGGRPAHAEGRLPATADWRALVARYAR